MVVSNARFSNSFTGSDYRDVLFLCDISAVHRRCQFGANQHVTPVYIERSVQDTGSPNIVTGLLADYRGFDTMWETTVMFLAGLTVVMLLSSSTMGRRPEKEDEDA